MNKRALPLAYVVCASAILFQITCVKPFPTPVTAESQTILVVNGVIRGDSNTTITITHTKSLSDTNNFVPENNAQLFIEARTGEKFPFTFDSAGVYTSLVDTLTVNADYRVHMITSSGREYASDFVAMKKTPDIDSVSWDQNDDIFIYVSTHDPNNQTRYYRWQFTETSEYHSAFDSHLDYRNNQLIFIEPQDYRYTCYTTYPSTNILIGTSIALSDDVINHHEIQRVPNDNSKTSVRYSIIVNQYALTAEAYNFWKTVRQNSELSGGLFQQQPSLVRGNIHNISDTTEIVLGYISASTVTEKRIFIRNNQLQGRVDADYGPACKETYVYGDSIDYYLKSGGYLPAYSIGGGTIAVAPNFCVDCRMAGGVTKKPDFW